MHTNLFYQTFKACSIHREGIDTRISLARKCASRELIRKVVLVLVLMLAEASSCFADSITRSGNDEFSYTVISEKEKTCMLVTKKDQDGNKIPNAYSGTVIIPEYYAGYKVTVIGDDCFSECYKLESVVIPNSVIRIGSHAFYDCTSLRHVEIGNSVKTIDSGAFAYCKLESLVIPDSVTEIGVQAFMKGVSGKVVLGESVVRIGASAFEWTVVTEINMPKSVRYIGEKAFYECINISAVHISSLEAWCEVTIEDYYANPLHPNGTVYMPNSKLYLNNEKVDDLVIPEGITRIKENVFCCDLASVAIPSSVKEIGKDAFLSSKGAYQTVYISSLEAWCDIDFKNRWANPLNNHGDLYLNGERIYAMNLPEGITEIKQYAFAGVIHMSSLTIPASVTSIGDEAFYLCDGLTSLAIPASVTSIGKEAFYECRSLKELRISNSVTSIGESAFSRCFKLTDVTLSNSLKSIENGLFNECSALTAITIPNSVTAIGEKAFYQCEALTTITIPNSVTAIGKKAFYQCEALTAITIPNSVTSIGNDAFCLCEALTEISIPDSVTSIGDGAFCWCTGLTELTLPGSLTTIGNNVFNGCTGLKKLTISETLTTIAAAMFSNCTGLTSLTIPKSIVSIGAGAFDGCNILSIISDAVEAPTIEYNSFSDFTYDYCGVSFPQGSEDSYFTKWSKFKNLYNGSLNDVTVSLPEAGSMEYQIAPEEIIKIGGIKIIGEINSSDIGFLNKLINLTKIDLSEATIVAGGVSNMSIPDPDSYYTFRTKDNTMSQYWACNLYKLTSVILPENLEVVGEGAFYGFSNLTKMIIPDSVIRIEESAFAGCSGLTELTIGKSVETIDRHAFYGCGGIKELTIPESVAEIEYNAFSGCTSLSTLYFNAVDCEAHTRLDLCSGFPKALQKLVIGDKVTKIPDSAFEDCVGLTELILPPTVTTIGSFAFDGCYGLTELTIPPAVTTIGSAAFSGCYGLTELTIPSTVTTIGSYAFYGCSGLTELTIPESVAYIGSSAFKDCVGIKTLYFNAVDCNSEYYSGYFDPDALPKQLQKLVIGNTVIKIPESAFTECSDLNELTIPESVAFIGRSAFEGCVGIKTLYFNAVDCNLEYEALPKQLQKLVIGDKVTKIPDSAFGGCYGLTELTIPTTVTAIGPYAFYGCSGLTELTIPPAITTIGLNTFAQCSGLTKVTLPENLSYIDKNAFSYCSSLTEITIPESVTTIEYEAFYKCKSLKTIYFNAVNCEKCYGFTDVYNIIIGNKVMSIPEHAFEDCRDSHQIWIKTQIPPKAYNNSIFISPITRILVPEEAMEAYLTTEPWSSWKYWIEPYGDSGIGQLEADGNDDVKVEGRCIIAPEGSTIFNLNGRVLNSEALPSGLYIVALPNGKSVKVMI